MIIFLGGEVTVNFWGLLMPISVLLTAYILLFAAAYRTDSDSDRQKVKRKVLYLISDSG